MRLDLLNAQFTALALEQNELAARIHAWLSINALADDQVLMSTLVREVNRLLRGERDGIATFRGRRREALAHALQVPEQTLVDWMDGVALVLDPALRPEVTTGVRAQATQRNIEIVEVDTAVHARREALRLQSDRREDAIVVLADGTDAGFFEGRGREHTEVTWTPLGYELARFPDVIPKRPLGSAATWAGDEPLIAHPALLKAIESGERDVSRYSHDLSAELAAARQRGSEPSFRLVDVTPWLARVCGGDFVCESGIRELRLADLDGVLRTYVWTYKKRLHAIGPLASVLAPLLGGHDVLVADSILPVVATALKTRNPFSDPVLDELEATLGAHGLSMKALRLEIQGQVSAASPRLRVLAHDRAREDLTRARLRAIAEREWRWASRTAFDGSRFTPVTTPFWLQRAADAVSLRMIAAQPRETISVVSLGGGRQLFVRIVEFADTQPTAMHVERGRIDGGDICVWLDREYDEMLESDSLTGRRERARNSENPDDDD
jgi:hypothetical protein